jgi:GNAT superfamily N-acetyltransferase
MPFTTRAVDPADAEAASQLVHASFTALAAADWEAGAAQFFLDESGPEKLRDKIAGAAHVAAAFEQAAMTGFILLPRPGLLGFLFVHPLHQRRGIARTLWEAARAHVEAAHPTVRTVELNATPNAVKAYRALGFVPISAEFRRGGCRATRMACWLPARALGAEVPMIPATVPATVPAAP